MNPAGKPLPGTRDEEHRPDRHTNSRRRAHHGGCRGNSADTWLLDSSEANIRAAVRKCRKAYKLSDLSRIFADPDAFERKWGTGRVSFLAVGFKSRDQLAQGRAGGASTCGPQGRIPKHVCTPPRVERRRDACSREPGEMACLRGQHRSDARPCGKGGLRRQSAPERARPRLDRPQEPELAG